jgi:hypothetical protein
MAMQHALTDPLERDDAAAQLDELALTVDGQPLAAMKQAVVDWHLSKLAAARSESWIPGLARSRDPVVEKLLERLYDHSMAAAIKRLRAENLALRRRLLELTAVSGGGVRTARYKSCVGS